MAETVLTIVSTVLLLSLVAVVVLWRQRGVLARQRDDAERQAGQLRDENAQLGTEIAVAKETQKRIEQSTEQLRASFAELSNEALDKSSKRFLELAAEKLTSQQKQHDASLKQRSQAIEQMLKPIRESLDKHETAVKQIEQKREGAYGSLRQMLTDLREASSSLNRQTTALETALRGSVTARGNWGEIALERIAELAGMTEHCDFDAQVTIWKGDQHQRPDMVVRLPADRHIVVDAKAVGANYFAACEEQDEQRRRDLLAAHVRDIESRVKDLSAKSYTEALPKSLDLVVLFIPAESLLSAAVMANPDLIENAIQRGVVIATPTTLIPLLRAVALGWREEKLAENAQQIRTLGVELHKRVATATAHLGNLGRAVGKTVEHYNKFVGSFETQVASQARKFEELGADSPKTLPPEGEITIVETAPRELRADTPTAS